MEQGAFRIKSHQPVIAQTCSGGGVYFDSRFEYRLQHYEEVYMVPDQTNHEVAEYTVEELLAPAPKVLGIRAFGERIVISLMEDLVRKAMMSVESF